MSEKQPQLYRLWIDDLDCGQAFDDVAHNWLIEIRARYPHAQVRIEPMSGEPTFPLGNDAGEQAAETSAVATMRCPHCQELISVHGSNGLFVFVCPHCRESANIELRIM